MYTKSKLFKWNMQKYGDYNTRTIFYFYIMVFIQYFKIKLY